VVNLIEISRGVATGISEKQLKKIQADHETGLTLTLAGRPATIKIGFDCYIEKLRMLGLISQFAAKTQNLTAIESIDLHNTNRIVLGPVTPDTAIVNNKEV